jgi:hypothetical protein
VASSRGKAVGEPSVIPHDTSHVRLSVEPPRRPGRRDAPRSPRGTAS